MTAPQVVDAFTFSTELDLLELRLGLLYDIVDRFVLVEATRTFSGLDKPLHFDENRSRFERFADKIEHVIVDDLPDAEPDRWAPEIVQRNAIARGLHGLDPQDIVIVADVDEIPSPGVIELLRIECPSTVTIEIRKCYFRPNLEAPGGPWPLLKAARLHALSTPQSLRDSEPPFSIKDGGAHLSYLMDETAIAQKFGAFSHAELDSDRWRKAQFLQTSIDAGVFTPVHVMLERRDETELNDVQHAAEAALPDLADRHELPPRWKRRLFCKYSRLRVEPWFSEAAVRTADRWFRRLIKAGGRPKQRSGNADALHGQ